MAAHLKKHHEIISEMRNTQRYIGLLIEENRKIRMEFERKVHSSFHNDFAVSSYLVDGSFGSEDNHSARVSYETQYNVELGQDAEQKKPKRGNKITAVTDIETDSLSENASRCDYSLELLKFDNVANEVNGGEKRPNEPHEKYSSCKVESMTENKRNSSSKKKSKSRRRDETPRRSRKSKKHDEVENNENSFQIDKNMTDDESVEKNAFNISVEIIPSPREDVEKEKRASMQPRHEKVQIVQLRERNYVDDGLKLSVKKISDETKEGSFRNKEESFRRTQSLRKQESFRSDTRKSIDQHSLPSSSASLKSPTMRSRSNSMRSDHSNITSHASPSQTPHKAKDGSSKKLVKKKSENFVKKLVKTASQRSLHSDDTVNDEDSDVITINDDDSLELDSDNDGNNNSFRSQRDRNRLSSMDPHKLRIKLKKRKELIIMLKSQLISNGVKPIEEVVPLEKAEEKLKMALSRLMEGDESAETEFSRWDEYVRNHPEFKAKEEQRREIWRQQNAIVNTACLRRMRAIVPADVFQTTLGALNNHLPPTVSKRVWMRKALWLTRLDSNLIAKIHVADLQTKYSTQGLDEIELRALWACMPEKFENDPKDLKLNWKVRLNTKYAS